ncbi:related to DEG1 - pseudouridine synthase [Pseudozyma flocculosa]|uniref:Related to DEG1 - pseudouridine synthase n=2 Tax=Pseudozyma flocculosa TaxID=84751 RepID=A0A5C3EXK7_9BASI|nr:related to DEG1 - pseudouridine synthase [Pseudozyma flocculosa]
MDVHERYQSWSKQNLVQRIAELEAQALQHKGPSPAPSAGSAVPQAQDGGQEQDGHGAAAAAPSTSKKRVRPGKKDKVAREFDISNHPCRKIALRFSYEGSGYSGLAAQNGPQGAASPLPTVEAVLWEALATARLVDPKASMEAAGWTRCGRTDRGVSAAGQVVSFWIRSKKVDEWPLRRQQEREREEALARRAGQLPSDGATKVDSVATPSSEAADPAQSEPSPARGAVKLESEELPYVAMLNRILPPSIRVQAWSPVRPDFSARFDCTYRHYKYFFTAGPSSLLFPATERGADEARAKRLDIAAMRGAARRLLGEHDFRNLCKIDASKQITNYRRRIDGVDIDLVSRGWPSASTGRPSDADVGEHDEPLYVLNLRGTAFLYHQVRNIMAVLFLVGARLERPEVVDELMNVERGQIARDRIQMRAAALKGVRQTANSAEPSAGPSQGRGGDEAEDAASKWWLPFRATASAGENKEWGRPQWMDTALSWTDDSSANDDDDDDDALAVYDTKPNYEMASDRPLVLWECGFLPSDIGWRAGTFDGPLMERDDHEDDDESNNSNKLTAAAEGQGDGGDEESARIASSTVQGLHELWTQMSIKAELQRHFILASASPRTGRLACRTEFESGRWPVFDEGRSIGVERAQSDSVAPAATTATTATTRKQGYIPLGYGIERGALRYIPLDKRTREEGFEEKNRRWLDTTGKRRAEREQTKAADPATPVDDDE